MDGYGVTIGLDSGDRPGVPLSEVVLAHHLTGPVRVDVPELSGGHLLHLALAACLYNDISRAAGAAGITLTRLEVTAGGGFGDGEPPTSTGISYDVTVAGSADDARLRALVRDAERHATIPHVVRQGTEVRLGEIAVET